MKLENYIDRKYPISKDRIKELFDEEHLLLLKKNKYGVAVLQKNLNDWEGKYKKGTIYIFKRYKEYEENKWTGEFIVHGIFKCKKGETESGYHSIPLLNKEINELLH